MQQKIAEFRMLQFQREQEKLEEEDRKAAEQRVKM